MPRRRNNPPIPRHLHPIRNPVLRAIQHPPAANAVKPRVDIERVHRPPRRLRPHRLRGQEQGRVSRSVGDVRGAPVRRERDPVRLLQGAVDELERAGRGAEAPDGGGQLRGVVAVQERDVVRVVIIREPDVAGDGVDGEVVAGGEAEAKVVI